MTKLEAAHLSRLADLGCMLCRRLGYPDTPAEIHHLRQGQGMAQRASHFLTVPLCPTHHRDNTLGIHGARGAFKQAKCDEMDLLADTLQAIFEGNQ